MELSVLGKDTEFGALSEITRIKKNLSHYQVVNYIATVYQLLYKKGGKLNGEKIQ